jgi:hypothetical protein
MRRNGFTATTLITCSFVLGLAAASRAADPIERFTAFAVDMSAQARPGARSGTIDIVINRWSTDAERKRLADALRENGTDSLLHELQKVKDPVGYIQTPGNVGYPLRFARKVTTSAGGERVLLGTDRPISYFEATNPGITTDYPFMVIDLTIGPNGEGQGRLMPLARVTANDDHVVDVENYTTEPVRLTQVKREK